jgi:hypothetical protein
MCGRVVSSWNLISALFCGPCSASDRNSPAADEGRHAVDKSTKQQFLDLPKPLPQTIVQFCDVKQHLRMKLVSRALLDVSCARTSWPARMRLFDLYPKPEKLAAELQGKVSKLVFDSPYNGDARVLFLLAPHLSHIWIRCNHVNLRQLRRLCDSDNLVSLWQSQQDDGEVFPAERFPALRRLALMLSNAIHAPRSVQAIASGLPALRRLTLRLSADTGALCAALVPGLQQLAKRDPPLQHFALLLRDVPSRLASDVAQVVTAAASAVTSLCLGFQFGSASEDSCEDVLLAAAAGCGRLRRLILNGKWRLTGDGPRSLARPQSARSLELIELQYNTEAGTTSAAVALLQANLSSSVGVCAPLYYVASAVLSRLRRADEFKGLPSAEELAAAEAHAEQLRRLRESRQLVLVDDAGRSGTWQQAGRACLAQYEAAHSDAPKTQGDHARWVLGMRLLLKVRSQAAPFCCHCHCLAWRLIVRAREQMPLARFELRALDAYYQVRLHLHMH